MQAFAVLASDGSIHTWGDANFGGTTVAVDPLPKAVALYSTQYAFAARLEDGGVVAWGDANNGGLIPPAKVSELYPPCLTVGLGGSSIAIATARDTDLPTHPLTYLLTYVLTHRPRRRCWAALSPSTLTLGPSSPSPPTVAS
eukprot:scaffold19428_cov63-Phaeocystis_antarctica.AAC.9